MITAEKSYKPDRKDYPMIKEKEVIKWLRECSDEGSGENCCECPYAKYEDCAGKLMQDAAVILAVEEDNADG